MELNDIVTNCLRGSTSIMENITCYNENGVEYSFEPNFERDTEM